MNKNDRLLSIDTLRGFDMLFIMGMSELIIAICSLFPGGESCWLARNMGHVQWNGLHFEDTIFPLFLFIAGISFPFSLARQRATGKSIGHISLRIVKRASILVLFGFIYNGLFTLDFDNFRLASVLGRIGIAWMLAAFIYLFFNYRYQILIAISILVGYWLLLHFVPGCDDPYSYTNNLVGYLDRLYLPGKLHEGDFDPEGLLSTIPAIVTALLGIWTGYYIKGTTKGSLKVVNLFIGAIVLLVVGLLWSIILPVNKKLWTSSFVLVVGGYSVALFALFYYIIDVKGLKGWTFPFVVIGLNSITIYMAQIVVSFWSISKFFLGGFATLVGKPWNSVILFSGYVAACWLFLFFLYKKKTFLKI